MPESLTVNIRLGPEENALFGERLRALVAAGGLPGSAEVRVRQAKPSVGGFALTFPPEVMVAILTATATATASEIVKTIWGELREFLKSRHATPSAPTKPIVIVINGQSVSINPAELTDTIPVAVQKIVAG